MSDGQPTGQDYQEACASLTRPSVESSRPEFAASLRDTYAIGYLLGNEFSDFTGAAVRQGTRAYALALWRVYLALEIVPKMTREWLDTMCPRPRWAIERDAEPAPPEGLCVACRETGGECEQDEWPGPPTFAAKLTRERGDELMRTPCPTCRALPGHECQPAPEGFVCWARAAGES
jgi:hypothetical protein